MELDSEKSFGSIHNSDGTTFTARIVEISKHTIPREKTQKWARSLRFLSPVEEAPAASPTVDRTRDCNCPPWRPFALVDAEQDSLFLTDATKDFTCQEHYVAVSYCWKSQKGEQQEDKRFKIRTREGIRKGTAPREIVERAVKFAASVGARFIWIDQECIRQDNREDKELGIQSMDLVYRQSSWPLALMDTIFTDTVHILALQQAFERGYTYMARQTQAPASRQEILSVTVAMRLLSQDRWLTRAWILQEAILSGAFMTFLCRSAVELPGDKFVGAPGEVQFRMEELKLLKHSVAVYSQLSTISNMFPKDEDDPNRLLRDLLAASNGFTTRITMGEMRWGSLAFNAVAAFNLLEGYSNSRVADRLAILANLCDYKVRLDTTILTSMGFGFTTCFLALTLLNGDISLLQFWSEVNLNTLPFELMRYRVKETRKLSGDLLNSPSSWETFSWLPNPGACLSPHNEYHLDNRSVEKKAIGQDDSDLIVDLDPGLKLRAFHRQVIRAERMTLTTKGLQFDGWLWTFSYAVDMRLLQHEWRGKLIAWEEQYSAAIHEDDRFNPLSYDIINWTPYVEIIKTILMFTAGKDVGEVLWNKGMAESIHLDQYGVSPETRTLLTDFIDPNTLLFIGDRKWPDCTETAYFRLLRDFMRAESSPWRWIVPLVVKTGMLQVWRIYYPSSGEIRWYSCGVFDCLDSASAFEYGFDGPANGVRGGVDAVVVPKFNMLYYDTEPASTTESAERYSQQRPSAWATAGVRTLQGEGQTASRHTFVSTLKGQGMIRGIWDVNYSVTSSYVLS